MKKLILTGLALIMVLLALAGCSAAAPKSNSAVAPVPAAPATSAPRVPSSGSSGFGVAPAPSISIAVPPKTSAAASADISANQSALPSDRMVVRTGNMQIVVTDITSVMDSINKVAANYGGYVVSSQKGKEGERNVGNISIRVLAENYDRALVDIRALAKSVTSESTNSQDVTEEYVDLDARVKNLQATEAQLQKIMQAATKTEDILAIQRELTNVRGQIDSAKGRMQLLQRTSSTSLIQIRLDEAVLAIKFSADKVSTGTDEPIRFTSQVIGGFQPYNYQWDFGDGITSTEANPVHSFKDAGVYYITLKVTDDKGYTSTLARNSYISVVGSWKPGSVASDAWNAFAAFGRGLVNTLIVLGVFSPVWIVIGGIIWLVIWRNNKKKKKTQ
jgi:PKD repeat protein